MGDTAPAGLLAGRTAVVTGAARGIGLAVATRFAREGAAVVVADLDGPGAAAAADGIAWATGATAVGLPVDVADPDGVERLADAAEAAVGRCDVVVANAGILLIRHCLDTTPAEYERVLRVNLTGAFVTATGFARRLRAAGAPGSVVLSSSLFGLRGGAGNAAYASSKFGMIGLAQSMAADLAGDGIRVNAVCPGQIGSDMMDDLLRRRAEDRGTTAEQERAGLESRVPLGRLGTAAEVADAYVYLASPLSRYVTGQHLVVDGGWTVG